MKCLQDAMTKGRRDHHPVFVEDHAVVLAEMVAKPVIRSKQDRYVRRNFWEAGVDEVDELEHFRVAGGCCAYVIPGDRPNEVCGGGGAHWSA